MIPRRTPPTKLLRPAPDHPPFQFGDLRHLLVDAATLLHRFHVIGEGDILVIVVRSLIEILLRRLQRMTFDPLHEHPDERNDGQHQHRLGPDGRDTDPLGHGRDQ